MGSSHLDSPSTSGTPPSSQHVIPGLVVLMLWHLSGVMLILDGMEMCATQFMRKLGEVLQMHCYVKLVHSL